MCNVNVEKYNGLNGLMVQCEDKAKGCIVAEETANGLGKNLQNTTPMSLLKNNIQFWFFPFSVE